MLTLFDFETAQDHIHPYIHHTPTSFDTSHHLYLKWENHQPTRSFKVRGAIHKILSMAPVPSLLISGSAGNHGQAVALAAQKIGTRAWIFVPEKTPHVKVNKMLELDAKVERVPGLFGDAEAKAIQTAQALGVPFISAYNNREVIAGAGTITLEWLDQLPSLGRLLVPVGGGGLIAGVGLAAKIVKPDIEIIGILSEASPYMYHHFYHGHMRDVVELPTLTDGLAGAIEPGSITLDWIFQACDSIVQVTETEVAAAVAYLYRAFDEVVEGSGAVGLAAVMSGKIQAADRPTGALVSGGNIDPPKLKAIIEGQYP